MPLQASLCYGTCVRAGGTGVGFPEFSSWFGNHSSRGKRERLLQAMNIHMRATLAGGGSGSRTLRLDTLDYLRRKLLNTLCSSSSSSSSSSASSASGGGGAEACVKILDEYGLSKEDFFETMQILQLGVKKKKKGAAGKGKGKGKGKGGGGGGGGAEEGDIFATIPSKTRAALTRTWNRTAHSSLGLHLGKDNEGSLESMRAKKKGKGKGKGKGKRKGGR